jgi:hypothetical protein
VFFVVGVAFLLVRDWVPRWRTPRTPCSGILLLLPFIGVWGASLAGIYPYVGSRHTAVLAPFAIAAASYLVAAASGQRLWAGLLVATLLMVVSNTSHESAPTEEMTENQSPALMASAVSHVKPSVPTGDLIVLDSQSSFPFAYYFCGPKAIFPIEKFHGDYFECSCNGYSVVPLHTWKLIPGSFRSEFEEVARSHSLKSGDRVWVYQTGWGVDVGTDLAGHDVAFRCLAPKRFGGGVTVTPFIVGQDFSPEPPLGAC